MIRAAIFLARSPVLARHRERVRVRRAGLPVREPSAAPVPLPFDVVMRNLVAAANNSAASAITHAFRASEEARRLARQDYLDAMERLRKGTR